MAPKSIKGLNFFLAMTDNSGKFADMDGLTQMFKYDDDGTYHTRFSTERKGINPSERSGTWKYDHADGNELTVTATEEKGYTGTYRMTFTFLSDTIGTWKSQQEGSSDYGTGIFQLM